MPQPRPRFSRCDTSFVFQAEQRPLEVQPHLLCPLTHQGASCKSPLSAVVPNAAMDAGGAVVRGRAHTKGALVAELAAAGTSWAGSGAPGLRTCSEAVAAGAAARVPRGLGWAGRASGQPVTEAGAWGSDQVLSRREAPAGVRGGGSGVWLTSQRTPLVAGGRTARESGGRRQPGISEWVIPSRSLPHPTPFRPRQPRPLPLL